MVVSEREVVACIRQGAKTVDAVGEACEAGTGCGSCRGGIEVLLEEERRRVARSPGADAVLAQLGLFGDGREG
jgi:bacterioferritin-associated ferredoxin